MDIVVASNNKNKIKEIRSILGEYFDNIYSLSDVGLKVDVVEDADTFSGNADIKAIEVAKLSRMISLADDSGLVVEALNGEPGVYSARYAGIHGDDDKNNDLLLKKLNGIKNRNAKFVSAISLCFPDGKIIRGYGEVKGRIYEKAHGEKGFGYDPLFFSFDLNKGFGEATDEEKNSVSHRYRALIDLVKKL